MRLFSFGGYGLALAALALVVFGAYDSYPSYQEVRFVVCTGKARLSVSQIFVSVTKSFLRVRHQSVLQ